MKATLLSLFLAVSVFTAAAQQGRFLTGPVIGHTTATSMKVWLAFDGTGESKVFLADSVLMEVVFPHSVSHISDAYGRTALTFEFKGLEPSTDYQLVMDFDRNSPKEEYFIRTLDLLQEDEVRDFNFMLGSCFFIGRGPFKAFAPGIHIRGLKNMAKRDADFMLWLGDNVYYMGADHQSYEGMFDRNLTIRLKSKHMERLLSNQPNYAIWDDHDYGPNNSDATYPLRDTALKVFTHFWPNPETGFASVKGNFFEFSHYDADFFMLDDRYYRIPPGGDDSITLFGDQQLLWLKTRLLFSKATFKFICLGSQFINEASPGPEAMINYEDEREEIINFIADERISGVIFLSGDRHYTDLLRLERPNSYPLYDFTSSPVLSPTHLGAKEDSDLLNDVYRVPGTLVIERNFGDISITGSYGNRVCTLKTFDAKGELLWHYSIHEDELKPVEE